MDNEYVDEVVEHLLSLTPEGCWTMENCQDVHLIFTGGEPLLGWQKFYTELLEHPRMKDLKNVTFDQPKESLIKVSNSIRCINIESVRSKISTTGSK